MDIATVPWGDKRTDRGVAHKMQVKSAVAPTATTFDITTSWYASPEPDISEVAAKDDRLAIGLWGNNFRSYRFVGMQLASLPKAEVLDRGRQRF